MTVTVTIERDCSTIHEQTFYLVSAIIERPNGILIVHDDSATLILRNTYCSVFMDFH